MLSLDKSIVLVGLMGAGKTSIGKRLAKALGVLFVDIDNVIASETGRTISWLFDNIGEGEFRKLERKIIAQQLDANPCIIATGGGAFIDDESRALIKTNATSIWLDAELGILIERVSRRNTRPLLEKGDKAQIMKELSQQRTPYYKQSDIHIQSSSGSHRVVVEKIIEAIKNYDQ